MQAHDHAEYEADKVKAIFASVLGNPERAAKLLEHIRYRTGLLLERRPGIFAFAHLTFQEYLAARAIHEGNQVGVDAEQLVREHDDGRWQEVIALYCGLTTTPAARDVINNLIAQSDTSLITSVLAEAYLAAGEELAQDRILRQKVLERIAVGPASRGGMPALDHFPVDEVAPIVNAAIGRIQSDLNLSNAYTWLHQHPQQIDMTRLLQPLQGWRNKSPMQVTELMYLLHAFGPESLLAKIAKDASLYASPGPSFSTRIEYPSQATIAIVGLSHRIMVDQSSLMGFEAAFLTSLRTITISEITSFELGLTYSLSQLLAKIVKANWLPSEANKTEFASLARTLAAQLSSSETHKYEYSGYRNSASLLNNWIVLLEGTSDQQNTASSPLKPRSRHRANKR